VKTGGFSTSEDGWNRGKRGFWMNVDKTIVPKALGGRKKVSHETKEASQGK